MLHDRIWCAPDDAAFLADQPVELSTYDLSPGRFVAATFSDYGGFAATQEWISVLAGLLVEVVTLTGLDVVLLPHLSSTVGVEHDEAFHQRLVDAAASSRVRALGVLQPDRLAWLTGQAAMVVSSRYHPVVFALHRGVPAIGLCVDDYTEHKIRGVMEPMGVGEWALSAAAAPDVLAEAIAECWQELAKIETDLRARVDQQREIKSRYWDAVADALNDKQLPSTLPAQPSVHPVALGGWRARNVDALAMVRRFSGYGADLREQLLEANEAADAAGSELAAVQRTKIMRWTRRARATYSAIRRRDSQ